jgi:cell division inhibitor SepF
MSTLEWIKGFWYQEKHADVYDSHDFDELWKTEEQDGTPMSRLLSRTFKKEALDKNYCELNTTEENINVIEHPTITSQSEVVVIEPRSFDEALDIVEELRCRKSIVLNLQYLDAEQSQRVVDFLSGATHALDGHQQRVGQGVFIFAPSNFTLNSESNEARALKDAFWGRSREREQSQNREVQNQYQYSEPIKKSSIF